VLLRSYYADLGNFNKFHFTFEFEVQLYKFTKISFKNFQIPTHHLLI
jgi:hypothetical protein